ncbi:uncharacterized protein LOC129593991 isoform X2 [Paramacrobiotus metropolitanus]|uniref:uncharacterized protein LOC129593991 isoform X2 n=1 Tax=Paramacrobiotus metropolitanus TaxID=2943436 RepID=UPI0024462FE9|nr:uncharacterized protein LOC129593991 isoform X2 [Paramacrobiotus metropolitanus]
MIIAASCDCIVPVVKIAEMSRTAFVILVDVSTRMKQVYSDIQPKTEDAKFSRIQSVFNSVVQIASEESGKTDCELSAMAFGVKTKSYDQHLVNIFSLLEFQNTVHQTMRENGYTPSDDRCYPGSHPLTAKAKSCSEDSFLDSMMSILALWHRRGGLLRRFIMHLFESTSHMWPHNRFPILHPTGVYGFLYLRHVDHKAESALRGEPVNVHTMDPVYIEVNYHRIIRKAAANVHPPLTQMETERLAVAIELVFSPLQDEQQDNLLRAVSSVAPRLTAQQQVEILSGKENITKALTVEQQKQLFLASTRIMAITIEQVERLFYSMMEIEHEMTAEQMKQIVVQVLELFGVRFVELQFAWEIKREEIKREEIERDAVSKLKPISSGYDLLTTLLRDNGAPYCDEYVQKFLTQEECFFLYTFYYAEKSLLEEAIKELPSACRQAIAKYAYKGFKKVATGIKAAVTIDQYFKSAGPARPVEVMEVPIYLRVYRETTAKYAHEDSTLNSFSDGMKPNVTQLDRLIEERPCADQQAKQDNNTYEGSKTTSFAGGEPHDFAENERLNARMQVEKCTDQILKKHSQPKSIQIKEAADIIKEAAQTIQKETLTKTLTTQQLDRIIKSLQPYMYGENTPLCKALSSAYSILGDSSNRTADWRMLLLITAGYTTDGVVPQVPSWIKVTVATCLITSDYEPKQYKTLRYVEDSSWSFQRRTLFKLCTTVPCRHPTIQFLRRQKWKIPDEGEIRLFAPVNDPEAIQDFTTMVQSLADSGDATANLIARVALDEYINVEIQAAANSPHKQHDATCYAYATATVFHLVMKRIRGRHGGVPAFRLLYNEFVEYFGTRPTNTVKVIETFASKYRLKYRQLNAKWEPDAGDRQTSDDKDHRIFLCEARQALNAGRPLIATYCLSKSQRENFDQFYKSNKQGVLTKDDLGECGTEPTEGHAVVLIHCDPVCLVFLNSRGKRFADNGLFRVADSSVLNCKYYEVYWEKSALTKGEKEQFTLSGYERAHSLARQLPDSVKRLPYHCPNCLQSSPANEYTGNFVVASCPKCQETFFPAPIGFLPRL